MKTVVQHCFGQPGTGGPIKVHDIVMRSSLLRNWKMVPLIQSESAGGLNLRLVRRFVSTLNEVRPDLVHVRGLGNEGFHAVLAARIANIPNIVLSVHGTVRDLQKITSVTRHQIVKRLLEPLSLRWATHLVTVCESAALRDFLVPFRHKFIGVVPNGVEVPVFDERIRAEMRQEFGVTQEEVLAVCVSRLSVEKGYLVLAEALTHLPCLKGKLKLLIVGDGPDRNDIESALSRQSNVAVELVGTRLDVGAILRAADLFVFPTLHENLSNALLEAMSHALPVVATAVGGNVEVLNGGGGVLIPPSDVGALARALKMYANNPAQRRDDGSRGRETVILNYTVDHMIERWDEIYRTIVGKP